MPIIEVNLRITGTLNTDQGENLWPQPEFDSGTDLDVNGVSIQDSTALFIGNDEGPEWVRMSSQLPAGSYTWEGVFTNNSAYNLAVAQIEGKAGSETITALGAGGMVPGGSGTRSGYFTLPASATIGVVDEVGLAGSPGTYIDSFAIHAA